MNIYDSGKIVDEQELKMVNGQQSPLEIVEDSLSLYEKCMLTLQLLILIIVLIK